MKAEVTAVLCSERTKSAPLLSVRELLVTFHCCSVYKAALVAEWLRPLISSVLNHSSSHRYGCEHRTGHMWGKASSACGCSGVFSWGSPVFALWLTLDGPSAPPPPHASRPELPQNTRLYRVPCLQGYVKPYWNKIYKHIYMIYIYIRVPYVASQYRAIHSGDMMSWDVDFLVR